MQSQRILTGALLVVLMGGCAPDEGDGMPVEYTPILRDQVAEWVASGPGESYDTETIYSYIDGHAEVYVAYGFKRCVSRRYASPDGVSEIVVDLFEMASPADAFGVFSHDRAGEVVAVGQGGVYRLGWLSFWSGSWCGSVYASGVEGDAREDVLALARATAASLPVEGGVPALVGALPSGYLDPASVCFLRSPQILNAHIDVGAGNPLGLGPETEAVVGKYDRAGSLAHLIVVRYPSEWAAEEVEARARWEAGADGPEMVLGRSGDVVAAVVGDETGDWGEALLAEILGGDQ